MQCQQSKYDHPELGEVTIRRSARAKRISIGVRPSGEVQLIIPTRGSEDTARKFLESKIEWIVAAQKKMASKPTIESSSEEEIEELRRRAKEYLPNRLAILAERFGFSYGRVTIRATRSKWGSCSWNNNISLSLFLMKLPEELIDFVLIHELCHTIHHNHSQDFHKVMNNCVENREKELHKALKMYHCR